MLLLPISLLVLLAAQPQLVMPVLQVVRHVVTRHLKEVAAQRCEAWPREMWAPSDSARKAPVDESTIAADALPAGSWPG